MFKISWRGTSEIVKLVLRELVPWYFGVAPWVQDNNLQEDSLFDPYTYCGGWFTDHILNRYVQAHLPRACHIHWYLIDLWQIVFWHHPTLSYKWFFLLNVQVHVSLRPFLYNWDCCQVSWNNWRSGEN